jgi:hypothetical protein
MAHVLYTAIHADTVWGLASYSQVQLSSQLFVSQQRLPATLAVAVSHHVLEAC